LEKPLAEKSNIAIEALGESQQLVENAGLGLVLVGAAGLALS
jgi:hypothetical protein